MTELNFVAFENSQVYHIVYRDSVFKLTLCGQYLSNTENEVFTWTDGNIRAVYYENAPSFLRICKKCQTLQLRGEDIPSIIRKFTDTSW